MWHLTAWFNGKHNGGAGLMIGINGLKGLFQS